MPTFQAAKRRGLDAWSWRQKNGHLTAMLTITQQIGYNMKN
ncbi:hypothetical protein [Synechococcus sp. CBW1108]|nr:hypothetical protein [Synechococcus sp. CBW1108]